MIDTTPIGTPANARLIEAGPMDLGGPWVEVSADLSPGAFYIDLDEAVVLADRLRELAAGRCSEADQATPIAVSPTLTVRLIDGDRSLVELLADPDSPSARTVFNVGFDEARQLADRLYELAGGHAQQ
ncbi:hypothetical protein [Mycobacterium sp.]|uniref:hypothetical protein n=1 Tax=Mycobacterium sp. TaxID=1785 RepID=UPI003F98D9A4